MDVLNDFKKELIHLGRENALYLMLHIFNSIISSIIKMYINFYLLVKVLHQKKIKCHKNVFNE